MRQPGSVIDALCADALSGARLGEPELAALLGAGPGDDETVFAAARQARTAHFGDVVFPYGFVYFSTYCRNACAFCLYRAGNAVSPRYRKTAAEVRAICEDLAGSGVVLLDLTMGEDPMVHDDPGYRGLLELVTAVRQGAGLSVMVSPGLLPDDVFAGLREAGADWYALYQETHTPALYRRLRVGQPFAARAAARSAARRAGLLVEDGLLTGVGDTVADRARSIAAMRDEGCEQVRVMTFVPQAGTPLAACPPPGGRDELLTIAVMRLAMPDRLIPASLDVDGLRGLEPRLQAGANVVTSLVPPHAGLAGVSQSELDIDEGHRTVGAVLPELDRLGLRAGTADEYRDVLAAFRARRAGGGR